MSFTITVAATEDDIKETAWKCLDDPDDTKEHKEIATLLLLTFYFGRSIKGERLPTRQKTIGQTL